MKTLSALLNHVGSQWLGLDGEVIGLTTDSRKATKGVLFVAICGTQVDAHQFIPQVLESGAWVLAQTGKIKPQKGIALLKTLNKFLGI